MSEKFEPCTLQEATHVEMGGRLHTLGNGIVERIFDNKYWQIKVMSFEIYEYIIESSFPILGIKTFKEVKPEPVVFEAVFAEYNGMWHPLYNLDDGYAYQKDTKARFRCVEILEDDK